MDENIYFDLPIEWSVDILSEMGNDTIQDISLHDDIMNTITIYFNRFRVTLFNMFTTTKFYYIITDTFYKFERKQNKLNDLLFTEDKINEIIDFIIDADSINTKEKKTLIENIQKFNIPAEETKKLTLFKSLRITIQFSARQNLENCKLISQNEKGELYEYTIDYFSDNYMKGVDLKEIKTFEVEKISLWFLHNKEYDTISIDRFDPPKVFMNANSKSNDIIINEPTNIYIPISDSNLIAKLIRNKYIF